MKVRVCECDCACARVWGEEGEWEQSRAMSRPIAADCTPTRPSCATLGAATPPRRTQRRDAGRPAAPAAPNPAAP
jgi:hypothetical protein